MKHRDLCLTFGYNTAVFNVLQRVQRIPNVINMDGIEWSRNAGGSLRQAILYVNERIACWVGNELIADHPRSTPTSGPGRRRARSRRSRTARTRWPTAPPAPSPRSGWSRAATSR